MKQNPSDLKSGSNENSMNIIRTKNIGLMSIIAIKDGKSIKHMSLYSESRLKR